jgi:hypothetical protein
MCNHVQILVYILPRVTFMCSCNKKESEIQEFDPHTNRRAPLPASCCSGSSAITARIATWSAPTTTLPPQWSLEIASSVACEPCSCPHVAIVPQILGSKASIRESSNGWELKSGIHETDKRAPNCSFLLGNPPTSHGVLSCSSSH